MRQSVLVCYDIREPRRLRRVFRALRNWGDHLQYSIFRCELNRRERAELVNLLSSLIKLSEDHLLFVDLGPADGRGITAVESLGRSAFAESPDEALIF